MQAKNVSEMTLISKFLADNIYVTFFCSAPYRRKSTCAVWPVSMNLPPGTNFSITWRPRVMPSPSPPVMLPKCARKRRMPGRTDNRETDWRLPLWMYIVQENKTSAGFFFYSFDDMQLCNHQASSVSLSLREWICAPWADISFVMHHMPKDFPGTAIFFYHNWCVIWCLRADL